MMMRSDELDKLEDSWIGVSRQIRNGDHIPKKNPDGRTESVRQSNFGKRGVAVEPNRTNDVEQGKTSLQVL